MHVLEIYNKVQTTLYMEQCFIGNLKAKDGDCSNAYTQEKYTE